MGRTKTERENRTGWIKCWIVVHGIRWTTVTWYTYGISFGSTQQIVTERSLFDASRIYVKLDHLTVKRAIASMLSLYPRWSLIRSLAFNLLASTIVATIVTCHFDIWLLDESTIIVHGLFIAVRYSLFLYLFVCQSWHRTENKAKRWSCSNGHGTWGWFARDWIDIRSELVRLPPTQAALDRVVSRREAMFCAWRTVNRCTRRDAWSYATRSTNWTSVAFYRNDVSSQTRYRNSPIVQCIRAARIHGVLNTPYHFLVIRNASISSVLWRIS